uniref:NADH-ubiquinone oxidoreductase chain 2 n=1 Tax=Serritermes serrifer TaxID=119666 RepID=A0A0A7E7S6_9NEOP|nr:NADH dehydrogenase subunit 2 [Serritermes serrifer]
MTNNPTKLLLLTTLLSGVMISVSSNSWFTAWMGLEINLLSFIPLMSNTTNMLNTESSLKYFLVQVLASTTMLFMIVMKTLAENMFTFAESQQTMMAVGVPLLMKMGAAPLHWWFPGVMEGLSWDNCMLLLTIQSGAPLMLMSYLTEINTLTLLAVLASTTTGAIGGMNQTSLRKILTYSSIGHTGWMLMAMTMGSMMWMMYFSIYSALVITIILTIKPSKISFINQVLMMSKTSTTTKMIMLSSMLSLGGLPPLTGFMPKWMILQTMMMNNQTTIAIYMTIMSTITLYYYLKVCYSSFMMAGTEPKWICPATETKISNITVPMTITAATLGMILCTIITNNS